MGAHAVTLTLPSPIKGYLCITFALWGESPSLPSPADWGRGRRTRATSRMCWRGTEEAWRGTEEAWCHTPSPSPCPLPSRDIFALRLRSGENPHPYLPQQTGEGAKGPERHQGCAGVALRRHGAEQRHPHPAFSHQGRSSHNCLPHQPPLFPSPMMGEVFIFRIISSGDDTILQESPSKGGGRIISSGDDTILQESPQRGRKTRA